MATDVAEVAVCGTGKNLAGVATKEFKGSCVSGLHDWLGVTMEE